MGANVQSNGYFPGYYSTKDVVFDFEGRMWTSSNANGELRNDCYHMGSLPVSSPPCNLLDYNKELLKQTLLKHEAIFRDQVQELHRVYWRQRELMDEMKRNELCKHKFRSEPSWSSFSLSSKSFQKICCPSNLPWSTAQPSVSIAENVQLPPAFAQETSGQMCLVPASTTTEESSRDHKVSESKYRKTLDLQLPADEYIDSEENESVTEVPKVSIYSLNGISQVACDSHDKPYGTNFKGFADLNLPFKLEKAVAKSYDVAPPTHYDLSRRTNLGSQNLPNDVIQNLNTRLGLEARFENPLLDCGKKHELLTGQSGSLLDSFAKVTCTKKQSISVESLSRNMEPFNVFSRSPLAVQASSASIDQSSKSFMGISGFPGDQLYQCTSVKSGPNSHNFLLSSNFCSSSKLLNLPSISTNDLENCVKLGSSDSHELRKHVEGSEDVAAPKNLNLNIMPADYSDAIAFQGIQIEGKENKSEDSARGFPWLEEKPYNTGGMRGLKLMKIDESNSISEKTLAFHSNEKPHTSDQQSLHVTSSEDLGEQIPAVEHLMKNEPKKPESLAGMIDLNSCIIEDEEMPMDVDAHAPVSPENRECSPPRGESDENQPEAPFQLAKQEDPEVQEEKIITAAEALVSISAKFVANEDPQTTTCPLPEYFARNPLHWFAGFVSATIDHLENATKSDFIGKASDLKEFLPPKMDYFEFMTLQLTETKFLDGCYKSVNQTEEVGGSSSPTQPRKGRRLRKDFQTEILPSLASLSRYEVTEDIQTIGGLVAAGNHTESGSVRSACRNALGKGRRRSCTSTSTITEVLLNMKQVNSINESSIEKRGLMSWEKASRKRRGQRIRNTNPQFLLSQVYN